MSMSTSEARQAAKVLAEPTLVCGGRDLDTSGEARPARLVVVSGSCAGAAISLGAEETTVGRAPNNDVVLPDISVSRRHAAVRREADGYVLVDQDSGNGTRVNGRTIQAARLRNGDEIGLGDAIVQFVDSGQTAVRGGSPVRRLRDVLRGAALIRPSAQAHAPIAIAAVLFAVPAVGVWRGKHRDDRIAPRVVLAAGAASGERSEAADILPQRAGGRSVLPSLAGEDSSAAEVPSPSTAEVPPFPLPANVARERARSTAAARSPSAGPALSRARGAYADGDLAKAIVLARGVPSMQSLLGQLEKFGAAWREGMAHAAEHRPMEAIAALERAESADAAIASPKGAAFSRKLRKTLAGLHGQLGTTQLAAGQLAPAVVHLRAALRYDPRDEAARAELQRMVALANEAYLRGYVAKDIDEDAAREEFRTVVAVLAPGDETARKARRWLGRLDGKAGAD
jgi:FHA domain-containing protein